MKKCIQIILIITIIICSVIIGIRVYNYYSENKVYIDLRDYNKDENGNLVDINKLISINNEYKFWLTIDNTNIDYPVVQGSNNEFYLNHNFYKEKSKSGTIFIDSNNNLESDKNIVIYGHNMKDKSMFYEINKFKQKEFFDNIKINIIVNNNIEIYEVFSVYVLAQDIIEFKLDIKNRKEYEKYISSLMDKSLYTKDIEVREIEEIITMATCSYEYDDARTIVHARRIE